MVDRLAVPPSRFQSLGRLHNTMPSKSMYFMKKSSGVVASFDPTDYGTVRAWYDPSDSSTVTIVGSGADTITNKEGTGGSLRMTTDANRPGILSADQNGLDVLDFDESEHMTASLGTLNVPYTIMVVNRFGDLNQAVNDFDVLCELENTGATAGISAIGRDRANTTADRFFSTDEFTFRYSTTLIPGQVWQVIALVITTGAPHAQGYIDDVASSAFTSYFDGKDSSGEFTIGNSYVLNTPYLGKTGDIIIWEDELSTGNLTAAYNALVTKWGL